MDVGARPTPGQLWEDVRICRLELLRSNLAWSGWRRLLTRTRARRIRGSPRDDVLERLGDALLAVYETFAERRALREGITVYEETLRLRPPGHPDRAHSLFDLASALWLSCRCQGVDASHLSRCIALYRAALRLRPLGDVDRAHSLVGLANALQTSFDCQGGTSSLTEAQTLLHKALHFCPPGDGLRLGLLSSLGNTLAATFRHQGDPGVLAQALALLREAFALCPPGDASRAAVLTSLAGTLHTSFRYHGGSDSLEEIAALSREALELRPPGAPARDESLQGLADVLQTHFELLGETDSLTEAVALHREALALRPRGHFSRHLSLDNLANALDTKFEQEGGLHLLAESIALHREALELRPPGHPERDKVLNNLANALEATFSQQADPAALAEAITLYREALMLCPPSHPGRATSLGNLATALEALYEQDKALATLVEAIDLDREALALSPPGNPDRAVWLSALANALGTHFDHTNEPDKLAEAIDTWRMALLLQPPGHPLRHVSLWCLGCRLWKRAKLTGDTVVWKESSALLCQAIKHCPLGHPQRASLLSETGRQFFQHDGPLLDIEQGLALISEALAVDSASVRRRLSTACFDLRVLERAYETGLKRLDDRAQDDLRRRTLDAYTGAIRLLPRAANFGLDHPARLQALLGADELGRNAAARALAAQRAEDAIEMLEEGRGVFWAQAFHRRGSGLAGVPEEDRDALQRIFGMLEHGQVLDGRSVTVAHRERELERRRLLAEQAEAITARVRTYPGHGRFFMPAAFDTLMASLPDSGFVVIVIVSKRGHDALLLSRASASAQSIQLRRPRGRGGFLSERIKRTLPNNLRQAVEELPEPKALVADDSRGTGVEKEPETLEDTLALLWELIVKPVVAALKLKKLAGKARPRVWWCMTGELGFLPIHAAGKYTDGKAVCASDFMVSSYIPTLAELAKARRDWQPIPRTQLTALLLCETAGPGTGFSFLSKVRKEVDVVRELFEAASARVASSPSTHTTIAEMDDMLKSTAAHILHLACHGIQDKEPLKSAFILHDGKMFVQHLMRHSLPHAVLAFLSACETAKGHRDQPDEAVHLAASMLFCGFRSVVATMWSISDRDGPTVASAVYRRLLARDKLELDDIAHALDEGVRELRETGAEAWRWAPFVHMGG